MEREKHADIDHLPNWVRAHKYMELTGHNVNTLKKLRMGGHIKLNRHYKFWPEGSKTIYYNTRAIDRLISKSKS
ncbi:hypothetical protein A3709_12820 [Halioglobus sp. HI00S01]|nr:hypothetical protein A3709_12820 [Halioglobus sp. HI00S01]